MGKSATKAVNNIFYIARKKAAEKNPALLSREGAEGLLHIDRTRLARIELEETQPYPEEVVQMSQVYNSPELCHLYCSTKCTLGSCTMNKLDINSDFDRLTLQILGSIENLIDLKPKLIQIAEDGVIAQDEEDDFNKVLEVLERIAGTTQSLKLWAEKNIPKHN